MENLEAEDFLNLGVVVTERGEVLLIRRVKKEVGKESNVLLYFIKDGLAPLEVASEVFNLLECGRLRHS